MAYLKTLSKVNKNADSYHLHILKWTVTLIGWVILSAGIFVQYATQAPLVPSSFAGNIFEIVEQVFLGVFVIFFVVQAIMVYKRELNMLGVWLFIELVLLAVFISLQHGVASLLAP